ncbi:MULTISPECIES: CRTAC1 family protein [Methylotuvimicrobium]|uniref:ASPIC/UnbV domain-containing protein n=2 Tax=Methylotuvimicrobium TaxID=2822410 RepID=G4SZF7_META2|nr:MULTISPECIES: CRTAC1 family protein [Methylotuvimicrobium]QCW82948.1 CRTAC1 family protein [Methylotuvimicrobium buryatense]CCE23294.1 conserved protein of unknown function [Methylotuvimicrobium alcaliphilum 20Z]
MNSIYPLLRRRATLLAALVWIGLLYGFMQPPSLSPSERKAIAGRFDFTRLALPEPSGKNPRSVRNVHPSLEHISAWISSVGASVALGDLDGDGLPNDLCHVDPRFDSVIIAPVPETGERYTPFELHPAPVAFDAATMAPMGCLFGDLNEDGLLDAIIYYWGRTPVAFLQRGDSTGLTAESFKPVDIFPGNERWFTNAATLADLDGDGHIDLVIGNYFSDGAQILDASGTGIERMHDTKSRSFSGGKTHLLLWDGAESGEQPNVRYRAVTGVLDPATEHGWALAVGAADLDGDLLPELYLGHDFGPDRLLHNRSTPGRLNWVELRGKAGLATPKSFVLGQDSFKGMGVDFGDLNGDGLLDLFVSNITSEWALQESNLLWLSTGEPERMRDGVAPYVQASEKLGLSRAGWGWDTRLADFDNSGYPEALVATGFVKGETPRWAKLQALGTGNDRMMSNPRHWPSFKLGDDLSGHEANGFFVRAEDGRFYNLASELQLDDPMVSRGIAVADVDGDGDLDFVVANQWERSYFFRNECPDCGDFIGLHLRIAGDSAHTRIIEGHPDHDISAYPAIGAQATVYLPNGKKIVAQVDGGNGHSGQRSPDLHFGLGKLSGNAPLEIELRWRGQAGSMHRKTLNLEQGWHTVILGEAEAENL